jgi:Mlc titration factor MtfA (ptsG expression regulator)
MIQFLLIAGAFVLVGIRMYNELVYDVIGPTQHPKWKRLSEMQMHGILKRVQFYSELSAADQRIFLERVIYVCENKLFIGMDGMLITDEVRVFVAASAVQVSFRLDNWKFPSFHTYRVYPESFYSSIFQKFLKGGAGKQGVIWFSYADYESGYADSTNGINLGLHEMAHALVIEMQNGNMDTDFANAYDKIEELSAERIPAIRSGAYTFLRAYAGTNLMEFIAVATEYFFERPLEFRTRDRELYDAVMWLYKQEPHTPPSVLQITNRPREEKTKKNYRYSKWHWSLTLVLLGIFVAPVIIIWQMSEILLDGQTLFVISSIVIGLSAILLYRPIVGSGALGTTQFLLCHTFGLGPFVLSAFLLLNTLVPIWEEGEAFRITSVQKMQDGRTIVSLENNAFQDNSKVRIVSDEQAAAISKGSMLIVTKQYGLFGMPATGDTYVIGHEIVR